MMAGAVSDLRLQKNDVLYISSVKDIEKEGTLSIYGDIRNPGDFPYVKNTSIQDLIVKAGGLLESASMVGSMSRGGLEILRVYHLPLLSEKALRLNLKTGW